MRLSGKQLVSPRDSLKTIFAALDQNNTGKVTTQGLKECLQRNGLHPDVINDCLTKLGKTNEDDCLSYSEFENLNVHKDKFDLILRSLNGSLAIPEWDIFVKELQGMYDEVRGNNGGKNASYIPQLARVNPEFYGLSVCTVDAQCWKCGDANIPYTVQSTSKPITLCMAVESLGEETVVKHVGHEPSGKKFNAFELDRNNLPHNPMINSGAIMTCSLLKPEMQPADRFDYVLDVWSQLAGKRDGKRVGFCPATYLSELNSADRNFALAYYMQDEHAFPAGTDIQKTLEFYFQCCSILVDCEDMATIAATLASGGICPKTGKRVFRPETVRNTLSLMFSCGMYDYSGEFAYSVGIPAKSGVSGCVMVVIPNVMGLCTFSPPLDVIGNSVKGIDFCHRLVKKYNFHIFDCLASTVHGKIDPRYRRSADPQLAAIAKMCYAASNGNLTEIQRLVELEKVSVNVADYDGRTALHLAACEGRLKVTQYLLAHGADPNAKDRWGHSPYHEALHNHQPAIAELLKARGALS